MGTESLLNVRDWFEVGDIDCRWFTVSFFQVVLHFLSFFVDPNCQIVYSYYVSFLFCPAVDALMLELGLVGLALATGCSGFFSG